MTSKNKFKLVLGLFLLTMLVLAPSLKVLADSSESQSTGTHNTESQNTSDHSGNSDNGVSESEQQSNERQVQQDVNTHDGQAQIQSELKSGNNKNAFQFELQTHEKVEFAFSYKSSANNSQSEVQMKFELRRLVEFVDNTTNPNNTVNGLDNMDTIVQQIDFEQLVWNMSYTTNTVGNQTVYNIDVNATQGSMVISLTFFIATGFVNQNSHTLTPNTVKFNLQIVNFPFKQQNSLLAAEVQIKNNVENRQIENDTENHKAGLAGPEQQLSFANNSVGAFFSWSTTYVADGVNQTVVISPVTNSNEDGVQAKMYFNFVHANNIFWDPEVGVTLASMTTSSAPGFDFVGFLLVVPVIALVSRKFKSSKKH